VVYVVGQVGAAKSVPLRQAATLAQVMAQSGDVTRSADPARISVVRLNDQGVLEAHVLDAGGRSLSQPEVYMAMAAVRMQANDLVVVPESLRSQLVRNLQDASIAITPLMNVLILRELYR
jgi:type II secretory pathway predicted ATPase ExeA